MHRVFLERNELEVAVRALVLESQRLHFTQLLQELSSNHRVSSKPLSRQHPFIDSDGVIRVGGRLHHFLLTYGEAVTSGIIDMPTFA